MGQCHWANTVQTVSDRYPTPMRSCGAFNPHVDLIAERRKADRLGQKRLSAILQRLALRLRVAVGSDQVAPPSPGAKAQGRSSPAY